MKRIKIGLIILSMFISITYVKADENTNVEILKQKYYQSSALAKNKCSKGLKGYQYIDFEEFMNDSEFQEDKEDFNIMYENVLKKYNEKYNNWYYKTSVQILISNVNIKRTKAIIVTRKVGETKDTVKNDNSENARFLYYYSNGNTMFGPYDKSYQEYVNYWETGNAESLDIAFKCNNDREMYIIGNDSITRPLSSSNETNSAYYIPNWYFETNLSEEDRPINYDANFVIKNESGEIIKRVNYGEPYPVMFENGYNPGEGYTEVNLDNYEYVLLSLKDYRQTKAFQTNLQVKGQIGITPIYNFGQTSKDSITGAQVQDRCNLAYENYTSYPFYILQSDLQNNAIYAVKECSEGSSFKFDNTVFDITYITSENKDNPTVTINGKTYDVIPYGELPSTATKNEEDNYIPGESENAITGNTVGIKEILKNAQEKMGEIWETMTYFTSFIGLIFSIFPSEINAVLISAFVIMIMLGVLKIFLGK